MRKYVEQTRSRVIEFNNSQREKFIFSANFLYTNICHHRNREACLRHDLPASIYTGLSSRRKCIYTLLKSDIGISLWDARRRNVSFSRINCRVKRWHVVVITDPPLTLFTRRAVLSAGLQAANLRYDPAIRAFSRTLTSASASVWLVYLFSLALKRPRTSSNFDRAHTTDANAQNIFHRTFRGQISRGISISSLSSCRIRFSWVYIYRLTFAVAIIAWDFYTEQKGKFWIFVS